MTRDKRSGGRPDGAQPVAGRAADKPVKPAKPVKAAKPAKPTTGSKPKKSKKPRAEPAAAPDIRVQLPYFAARIGVFVVALVAIALFTDLVAVMAVLLALIVAGVTTYPLGRMQKKAAARAAGARPDSRKPPQAPAV